MTRAGFAVCVLPAPPKNAPRATVHGGYIHEILGHAGLCYQTVTADELADALADGSGLRLLLTVGEGRFSEAAAARLEVWVEEGGAWLSLGGLCGMDALIGASAIAPGFVLWGGSLRSLAEGYLDASGSSHPALSGIPRPLHYFGGVAVQANGATVVARCLDAHGRPSEMPALLEHSVGAGRTMLIAPDVTGTVVRVQQGVAITRDGVAAPDGTAPIDDGVLKSGDGFVLDWLLDREEVPGTPGLNIFLQPIADQWRSVVLRAVFHLTAQQEMALPLLWYYPDNLPALGHLSHDTDGNTEPHAWKLLETLAEAKVRSTWCVILPGYPPEIMDAIRQAGHEFATHYDAMSEGLAWGEAEFDRQWRELCALFGNLPVSNKNHYLRWQDDTEFFDWCIERGIALDQSKGASKTGEAGFNFGSCHPYRPVAPDGRVLPILELATITQDLLVFAPETIVPPLLDAVEAQHGILHLLFHPAHMLKPGVAESLLSAVRAGEARGLQWRTASDIAAWENARRSAKWETNVPLSMPEDECDGGHGKYPVSKKATDVTSFVLTAGPDAALPGATVLVLAPDAAELTVHGEPAQSEIIERWGIRFHALVRDIDGGESLRLDVQW